MFYLTSYMSATFKTILIKYNSLINIHTFSPKAKIYSSFLILKIIIKFLNDMFIIMNAIFKKLLYNNNSIFTHLAKKCLT